MPRNKEEPDYRLLSKVSKLYYEHELTQQGIADTLHLSRQKVSRLLAQAREEGIVQITVLPPIGVYAEIEERIEQQFGLAEAVVVEVPSDSAEAIRREVGVAAADHLSRAVMEGDRIGVSWGTTLKAMVDSLQPIQTSNVHVVQILGGIGPPEAKEHATELSRGLAHVLGARLTVLPAPGLVDNPAVREAITSDRYVRNALELFEALDTAYLGIGALETNAALKQDGSRISQEEYDELVERGAVGDMAMRFFDADGLPIESSLNDRMIGITLEQMNRVDRVVGVAGGMRKHDVILGALRGGLVDVLITDQRTAEALVAEETVPERNVGSEAA